MSRQPVRIIGAGIGGLTLGRCLLKHGIPAVLYDWKTSAPFHGYGITIHESSYKPVLEILNLDESTFRRQIAVDGPVGGSGDVNPKFMLHQVKENAASFRAHRGKLEGLLREGLDIPWGHGLDKVEEMSAGMVRCLQNGQRLDGGYIVGADGPHSATRKSLLPNVSLEVLPYVAFNGKRRVQRPEFDEFFAPTMGGSSVIETKQGNTVLNVSISEHQKDTVTISWIFSRPAEDDSDLLHKPNRPASGAREIPEEFFDEIKALDGLQQPFKQVFDSRKLKGDRILHWLMRTLLVDHQQLRDLADKGVFFVGDAVHAEPILGGEGANNAITDGIELAHCISTSGLGGGSSWYDSRYPAWEAGVRRSKDAIKEMHGSPDATVESSTQHCDDV